MNPQSSRPSVALGAVPIAPKPAPNPITTNMPQFGSAPSLASADSVPTLPPVSPSVTQPLTPASTPAPAPAPAPVSAMPQYMNTADTKMIPVVDQPLNADKVLSTPVEQYNPFSSMPATTQPTAKKSSGRTLNLILGLLSALFVVAAVIFFILWQQAASASKVISSSPEPTPEATAEENPVQPRHLSCRGVSEPTDADLAAGVVSGSAVYDVYYPEADPSEIRITFIAEYNSPEAASIAATDIAGQNQDYLASVFSAVGIDPPSEEVAIEGNFVKLTYAIPISQLTDQNLNLDGRYLLISATGLPHELSADRTNLTVSTDFDTVRTNYESAGFYCEEITE